MKVQRDGRAARRRYYAHERSELLPATAYELLSPVEPVDWKAGLLALAEAIRSDSMGPTQPFPLSRGWVDRSTAVIPELPALEAGHSRIRQERAARRRFSTI